MKLPWTHAKPKKQFQPANPLELIRGWLLHAHKYRDCHDLAGRRNNTYRYWLGVTSIILSAFVGSSLFATLLTQVKPAFQIIIGLGSILAAVLASLQTFFNFAGLTERHRLAGVKYKAIIWELEQILSHPIENNLEIAKTLDDIRKRLALIEKESPVVPESIYQKVEDAYQCVTFPPDVESLTNCEN